MKMKWIIITSQVGKKIRPVQEWLLDKYAPNADIHWVDLGDKHIENWCKNVAIGIRESNPSEYTLMMLDDHLIFSRVKIPMLINEDLERLELGQRWSHHKTCYDRGTWLEYRKDTNYKVSTQPSIWDTKALLRVLQEIDGNPWEFERKGLCRAGIVKSPAMRFIAESAISKRKPGMVNLNGIEPSDRDELIALGLINESEIIYKWK